MADYLFVNGTDAQIANINAGGDDVSARSSLAATATTAEFNTFLTSAAARAVLHTATTADQKKALAYTLLREAGVSFGDQIASASDLADSEKRNKFRIKAGRQEATAYFEGIT